MQGHLVAFVIRALAVLALTIPGHGTWAAEATPQTGPATMSAEPKSRSAEQLSEDAPALMSADQVIYDETLGVVTATGNVEISQGERVLLADTVSYNQRTNVVTASGNVSLLEPTGDVVFADFIELTDDLQEGFVRDIRILMSDNSRIAAADGTRTGGKRTIFRRGVFSPCKSCRDNPDRAPLWQIKAARIVHDQEDQTIRYSNAWMEIFGVPVFYTPYFEHPDPTVERQSGFLAPTVGSSQALGGVLQVPYFWNFGPDSDFTFEPIFTTKQGAVIAGEYRQLFSFGQHEFRGSGTIADRERDDGSTKNNDLRGHIDAKGIYNIDRHWRTGFDLNRASDDTYLRLYNFSSDSFLTSNIFVERFEGRDYFAANGFSFQGLREEDRNREIPIVFPKLDYNFVSEPWLADSTFSVDANSLVLTRLEGRDTHRLSLQTGWQVPFTDPIGGAYTLAAKVQTDGYYTHAFDPGNDDVDPEGPTENEWAGRIFPQLALNWRYPWASYSDVMNQVIEPVAQIVVGTNSGNPNDIPNEDSQDFVFDDTNLFSLNRFPGLDRVDEGQRVDYGIRWAGVTPGGGKANTFVGQSYRLTREEQIFPEDSGVEGKLSDIVGRIGLKPLDEIDLLYRFRLDKTSFRPRRHELDLRLGPSAFNVDLAYLFIDAERGTVDFGDRQEVNVRAKSRLNENWSAFVSTRRDLENDDTLRSAAGISYQDECFNIELVGQRRFFSDREVEPDDSIFLRIEFKHLGGFGTSQ